MPATVLWDCRHPSATTPGAFLGKGAAPDAQGCKLLPRSASSLGDAYSLTANTNGFRSLRFPAARPTFGVYAIKQCEHAIDALSHESAHTGQGPSLPTLH